MTPFGSVREERELLLAALPGKAHHERSESLNRASKLFGDNSTELLHHLAQFVGTSQHVRDLTEGFGAEANRLLHNYLASVASLRDVQRAMHRSLWPDRPASAKKGDERTIWEIEVWSPKAKGSFGSEDIVFLTELRNYMLHYSIPRMRIGTSFHASPGLVARENTVTLYREELLKYKNWKSEARRYIESFDDSVPFLPPIEHYSRRVREFYGWFWEQVASQTRSQVDEFLRKSNEFGRWMKVENAWPEWDDDGDPVPGTLRKNRAAARAERAAYGTSGWRTITVASNGDTEVGEEVGETDWPPLPRN